MLIKYKKILTFLLAFGIGLAQCTVVFAEYNHPAHAPDAKCAVCHLAGHLSHALGSSNQTLDIDHYAPLLSVYSFVYLNIPSDLPYLIRGPPSLS